MVRGLNNRNSGIPAGHEALLAPGSTLIPSPRTQSDSLIRHYAAISRLPHQPEDRLIKRTLHRVSVDPDFRPFSPELVRGAIAKAGGSKARGIDGISYPHLKHLGPIALDALTAIYNWSVSGNCIPTRWKVASVIPILKPGKDPTSPSSYRPISLLSNVSKILERLVLNEIAPLIPLSSTQHGFRPQHSTTTLLCSLSQSVLEGFNEKKPASRSLIAAIDISKAFDTVPRYLLIAKILQSEVPPNLKKWLANFISGRQASVSWGGTKSKTRMFPNGVPQGAVLSPTLFNLFMSDLPTPLHPAVTISSYADDLTITSQHHKVDVAAENLQSYIHQLEAWLDTNRMEVSAQKSSITLLTPHTGEYRLEPAITLRGAIVPVNPTSKILGVTLDRGMTFGPHSREVIARAKPRLNVMKALSSTTFGHQKEAQTALYKQFIRPVLEYASPAWCPDLAPSHMSALQRTQNAALRVATGCTRSSPIPHLHAETKVLPLKEHTDMRGVQFFVGATNPDHPCSHLHNPRVTSRRLRSTPASSFTALHSSIPPTPLDRNNNTWIHQQSVSRYLESSPQNSLLGEPPPPTSGEELLLSRADRVPPLQTEVWPSPFYSRL